MLFPENPQTLILEARKRLAAQGTFGSDGHSPEYFVEDRRCAVGLFLPEDAHLKEVLPHVALMFSENATISQISSQAREIISGKLTSAEHELIRYRDYLDFIQLAHDTQVMHVDDYELEEAFQELLDFYEVMAEHITLIPVLAPQWRAQGGSCSRRFIAWVKAEYPELFEKETTS